MEAKEKIKIALTNFTATNGGRGAQLIAISREAGVKLKRETATAWPKGKAYFLGVRIVRSEDLDRDEIKVY